jgi:hypothetical protein
MATDWPAMHRYRKLKEKLDGIGTALAGTLLSRRTVCGKATCACASDPAKRHGPYWQLTWKQNGKTATLAVPAQAVPLLKEWIANSRRMRRILMAMECTARQAASRLRPGAAPAGRSKGQKTRPS